MPGALAKTRVGVAIALIVAVSLSACGRRGDPLPPPGAAAIAPAAEDAAEAPAAP